MAAFNYILIHDFLILYRKHDALVSDECAAEDEQTALFPANFEEFICCLRHKVGLPMIFSLNLLQHSENQDLSFCLVKFSMPETVPALTVLMPILCLPKMT